MKREKEFAAWKLVVVRRKWEWCTNWMWCAVNDKNLHELKTSHHFDWLVRCSVHYKIARERRRTVVAAASNWILTSRLGADTSTNMILSFFFSCCSLTLSQIYLVSVLLCRRKELMPWNYHSPTLHTSCDVSYLLWIIRICNESYAEYVRIHGIIGNAIIWKFIVIISNHLSRNQFHAITRLPSADKLRRRHCNPSEK